MKKTLWLMFGIFFVSVIFFWYFNNFSRDGDHAKQVTSSPSESKKMCLLVPTIARDFNKLTTNFKFCKQHLNFINKVVFIGNEEVEKLAKDASPLLGVELSFINENDLIDVNKVRKLMTKIDPKSSHRSGWYVQQFLKMQYCKICKDEYYLIWDSDTIPLKNIDMFNDSNGKPFFDVKTEYHEPYFATMKKIFPNLGKKYDFSFISEHMLIKTYLMSDLIDKIQDNKNIDGDTWYEKIINSINPADLRHSGFSEFETYGTFVQEYHPKVYEIRQWHSLRGEENKYNFEKLSDAEIKKLAESYDAISFEH